MLRPIDRNSSKLRSHAGARLAAITMSALLSSAIAVIAFGPAEAVPTADVAKKCYAYAYKAYPRKRPGSVKGSSARQRFFADCMAKDGEIPEPLPFEER